MSKIKLSEYCKQNGISYITGLRWFKNGTLPAKAQQTQSGTILVDVDDEPQKGNMKQFVFNENPAWTDKYLDNFLKQLYEKEMIQPIKNLLSKNEDYKLDRNNTIKILNKPKEYVLVAQLSGFNENEISITAQKHPDNITTFTIDATHEKNDNEQFIVNAFKQSVQLTNCRLTNYADNYNIKTSFINNILQISIPKLPNPTINYSPFIIKLNKE